MVNRSKHGNACDFRHGIIDCIGNNCLIPSKGYCFIKSINNLTGRDYKEAYLESTKNEKYQSTIMTKTRIQPCLTKLGTEFGYYKGKKTGLEIPMKGIKLYIYITIIFV